MATALVKMLHMLYDVDILSEEAILSWHGNVLLKCYSIYN